MSSENSYFFITETMGFGGTEIHTIGLITHLLNKHAKVRLICCQHGIYQEKIDHPSLAIESHQLSVDKIGLHNITQWNKLVKGQRKSVLILPKGRAELFGISSLLYLWCKFKKIVYIEHSEADEMPAKSSKKYMGGAISGLGFWWFKEKLRRMLIGIFADKIIAVSKPVAKRLVHDYGWNKQKITVVENGVSPSKFQKDLQLGLAFRKKLNVSNDTFIFGMLTRLDPLKGVDNAIRAFAQFLESQPELTNGICKLVIVGEGQEEHNLKSLVSSLGVSDSVIFSDFIEEPKIALSCFDTVLFPSRKEGLPLSLLEAMACECLPVVNNVGGMPGVVDNPLLIAELGNTDTLTHCMRNAMRMTSAEKQNLTDYYKTKVNEEYDEAKTYEKIAKIVQN
ncbi:MAG: glycosyltransferase family 4 protein [Glaciecola sp.]